MSLQGRIALVTGASQGIGRACALELARSGATVALAARTENYEREVILSELKRHQRMTDTAKALGLERSHLYKKCQQLGIDLRALRNA